MTLREAAVEALRRLCRMSGKPESTVDRALIDDWTRVAERFCVRPDDLLEAIDRYDERFFPRPAQIMMLAADIATGRPNGDGLRGMDFVCNSCGAAVFIEGALPGDGDRVRPCIYDECNGDLIFEAVYQERRMRNYEERLGRGR